MTHRKQPNSQLNRVMATDGTGYAIRTIAEVADELERRTGVRITRARVWQICRRAEQKLRKALEAEPV